jgi:hypothetical protein
MAQYPLYTSRGAWAGLLMDGYLYNPQGEWIGWVEHDGAVYSVAGQFVGALSRDFRVLRKRSLDEPGGRRRRPPALPAAPIAVPANIPLPPLLAEIGFDTVDVFEEMPELLHTVDADPAARDIGE